MDEPTEKWLAETQKRINLYDQMVRRHQALHELLNRITGLMKAGKFKDAALLRKEFDSLRSDSE